MFRLKIMMFAIVFLFVGCGGNTDDSAFKGMNSETFFAEKTEPVEIMEASDTMVDDIESDSAKEPCIEDIFYWEGVDESWDTYLNDPESAFMFPVDNECVPDMETAIEITQIIVANLQRTGVFTGYVPVSVFYNTEQEVWVVSYQKGELMPGASLEIAVRRENAEIVYILNGGE